MGKVLTALRHMPKRTAAVVAILAAAVIVPVTMFAWGPSRTTFTEQNPATYVTFNSITNNSVYGDERNFVNIKDASNTNDGGWTDEVTVQPGKEYVVRMYVHNNASANLNLVAQNTRASATVPTTTGKSVPISGFVSADNANPAKVWDDVNLKSDKNFNLAYIPGSASFHNNSVGQGSQGAKLSDGIVTSAGALLGYDKLDGKIPGCYQYSGYVYFKVKPQFATDTTDFSVSKQVRKDGATDGFKKSVAVNPGDTVNYRIEVKNTGNASLNNVTLKDQLPTGVTLVPGTAKIMNANNPGGAVIQDGDKIVSTGVNIGTYTAGSNALVVFSAKIKSAEDLTCGMNTLTNKAIAQPEGKTPKEDTADVTVNKECQPGKIQVCDINEQRIIEINESDYDASKHSKNFADCKKTEEKCDVPGKETLPKDSPDCKTTTVEELPQTGLGGTLAAFSGLGALTAGAGYYIRSVRARRLSLGE